MRQEAWPYVACFYQPSVCDVNPFSNTYIRTIAHKAYIPGIYNTWYT